MASSDHERQIVAGVDLGSTSVHLLVARIVEHRVEPLVDESEFLGLGDAVEQRGVLGAAGRAELIDVLAHFAWTAREAGATSITFVGTEPLRRLADAARIVGEVDPATGVALHVLDHEEEAFLTLTGVTEGRPVSDDIMVIDIGGGSSEFVTIGPERRARAAGVRVGAARLTSQVVGNDPPTDDEIVALRAAAHAAVTGAPEARPDEVVIVGGTASNLARLVAEDGAGERLGERDLEAAFRLVAADPADAVAAARGIRPARARILAAGAALVEAILDRYGATTVRVVDRGIREGLVLAVGHAGPAWRDRLESLAHGWVDD